MWSSTPRDVIAVPEVYGTTILDLPRGVNQVILNQNAFNTFDLLASGGARKPRPYVGNPDLAAVVVVSGHNAEALRYAFPGAPIHRWRHAIDPAVHHAPATAAGRRIAFMPRRRAHEARAGAAACSSAAAHSTAGRSCRSRAGRRPKRPTSCAAARSS